MTTCRAAARADALVGPPRLLTAPVRVPTADLGDALTTDDLDRHLADVGSRRAVVDLVSALDDVGLAGRGGAHFPVARKWRAAMDAARRSGRAPMVVANGAEGEPASAKDQVLLAMRPHLVLDGLADTAEAIGADETVLWLHGDAHLLHSIVQHALAERRAAGLREPPVRLVSAPPHYLAGESSAVVRGLSGGPALPVSRLLPTALAGVDGRPTVVHNVDTLARTALLARCGPEAYQPTALVTVLADGWRTVLEVDSRTPLHAILHLGGWPVGCPPQAVLIGGYGGSWLRWENAADAELSPTGLRATGASLGAGVLAPLPPRACGVAETARLTTYLARSSARQCGPCVLGLGSLAAVMSRLGTGSARRGDVDRLLRWAREVDGRGACHHPDGAVRMLRSALVAFDLDVEAHRRHRPCGQAGAAPVLPVPETP